MGWKLQEIKGAMRHDHHFLEENDVCAFYGDYTAYEGYGYSATNQLIHNLKKCVSLVGTPQYRYKFQAIRDVAGMLIGSLNHEFPTIVPIPPSKAKNDPKHDDRLVQILELFDHAYNGNADVRELVVQASTTEASHLAEERLSIEELVSLYRVDTSNISNPRSCILIFDDVLTTGRHFKAMKQVLEPHFPGTPIYGLFVARRVPKNPFADFEDIDF